MIATFEETIGGAFAIATAIMVVLVIPVLRGRFYRRVRQEGGFLAGPAHLRSVRSSEYVRYQSATVATLLLAWATLMVWNVPLITQVLSRPDRYFVAASAQQPQLSHNNFGYSEPEPMIFEP